MLIVPDAWSFTKYAIAFNILIMIKRAPEHPQHLFRMKKSSIIQIVAVSIAIIILAPQFKDFSGSFGLISEAKISWIVFAGLLMLLSIVFAALVYMALVPKSLPFKRTVLIQMATYFTNRLLPSGLGGIGFNALYLVKQARLSRTDAAIFATANNMIGFIAFSICIALASLIADSKIKTDLPLKQIFLITSALVVVAGTISLIFKKVQKRVIDFLGHMLGVIIEMAKHPRRIILSTLASMGITACYAAVLWAATKSVGIELSIMDIFIAFVVGNTALTVSPTPGGIGAVEIAITGVIISADVPQSIALASVIIFRLISYWLPILPGYIAFKHSLKANYV